MEETEAQEIQFPILHDKCPSCGSARRLAEMMRDEEATKGRMPKDLKVALRVDITAIEDPTRMLAQVMAPVIISLVDCCYDCGTYYAKEHQKQVGPVQARP